MSSSTSTQTPLVYSYTPADLLLESVINFSISSSTELKTSETNSITFIEEPAMLIVQFSVTSTKMTNVPKRHRTPGFASLYNDQETTPLGPYHQDADDERLTRTVALRIDPNVTRIFPYPLAFPNPIVLSLANSEPINDISSYNIRSTLLALVAEHNKLCDLANHIADTQTQRELDDFDEDHQYFQQRDDIFGKLVIDQNDTYLNTHMPHGSDIRAILSYSITMTLETYPDMPTDPAVPCFVDTFVSDLDSLWILGSKISSTPKTISQTMVSLRKVPPLVPLRYQDNNPPKNSHTLRKERSLV